MHLNTFFPQRLFIGINGFTFNVHRNFPFHKRFFIM